MNKKTNPLWYFFIKILPKNLFSLLMGHFAEIKWPKFFVRAQINTFIKLYKINLTEVKNELEKFSSLQDFFCRELTKNARPINFDSKTVISPCDGYMGVVGEINNQTLIQAKSKLYNLSELLCDEKQAQNFAYGSFATFYLAPSNYHRFHSPISGYIEKVVYQPGFLWPVNEKAVRNISNLFCVNERVMIYFTIPHMPEKYLCLIAIGACSVGKIALYFDNLIFNSDSLSFSKVYEDKIKITKGQLLGEFRFGSTILLVASNSFYKLNDLAINQPIEMGKSIGVMEN